MPPSVPRVIAHRGASAEAPENTLPAFRLAVDVGAGGVECDVRLTADGHPVILHDETVDRTTDGTGDVAGMPLDEVRRLDAGAGRGPRWEGTPVPTLGEVLDLVAGRAYVDLEIKADEADPGPLVEAVAEAVRGRGLEEATLVSSFAPEVLEAAAGRLPEVPLAPLTLEPPDGAEVDGWPDGVVAVGLPAPQASAELVERLHGRDLAVFAWTVDDPDEARDLYRAGVDGIATDDPRRILRVSPP